MSKKMTVSDLDEQIRFAEEQIAGLDALKERLDTTDEKDYVGIMEIMRDMMSLALQDQNAWLSVSEEDIAALKDLTEEVGTTEACESIFEEADVFFGNR